jgi:hypothetical protein
MTSRFLVVLLLLVGLYSCTARTTLTSTAGKDRPILATSSIDDVHRLALKVMMSGDTQVAPGMTALRIFVLDSHGAPVSDAIVYAEVRSVTDETPRLTLIAASDGASYRVDLPLVYGSSWTVVVKAFSSRRNAVLTISEDLS